MLALRGAGGWGCCSACLGASGSEAGGAPVESIDEMQPARTRPSSATSASVQGGHRIGAIARGWPASRSAPWPVKTSVGTFAAERCGCSRWGPRWRSSSVSSVRRSRSAPGGWPRSAGRCALRPIREPERGGFQAFSAHAGGSEDALISFQDGDRERLRPVAPEIHVDRASALADRQNLAFYHREMAPLGHELRPALGREDDIIRFAPEAKLAPRGPFLRQKLVGAGAVPDMGGNPGKSLGQHRMRDRWCRVVLDEIDERERAAVAVRWPRRCGGPRPLDPRGSIPAPPERRDRPAARGPVSPGAGGSGTSMPPRRISRPSSRTKLRPSVIARTCPLPAISNRQAVAGRLSARTLRHWRDDHAGDEENPTKPRERDAPTPAHTLTKRSEWGGTAAIRASRWLSRRGLLW